MIIIEEMLTGQVHMSEFITQLKTDPLLQEFLRNLVPEDARYNPDHALWKQIYYGSFKQFDFDFLRFLNWICRYDGSIGDNLDLFSCIRCVYSFYNPDIKVTSWYEDSHALYLDVIRDCFDGSEVRDIVEKIILDALPLKYKKLRIQQAKRDIEEQFHVVDKKRPRWIQGPEWPMGTHSPMMFISQKRSGEVVRYTFKDVDTDEIRVVEEYY